MFEAVWKHLTEVILKAPGTGQLTERESETRQHDAFCDTRCGLYLGGNSYFSRLNQHISDSRFSCVGLMCNTMQE